MKYRDRTTGQIYGLVALQQKFSNVSFPFVWDTSTYDFTNVDPVLYVPEPLPSTSCRKVEYAGVQLINEQWTEVWNELQLHEDAAAQSVCEEERTATQWIHVRAERNRLLAETDYTQLSDTPISESSKLAFQTYRQALRNITTQPDPYNITWPTIPVYVKE
jgi:hypothetical protein